jgi:hypothetical protein
LEVSGNLRSVNKGALARPDMLSLTAHACLRNPGQGDACPLILRLDSLPVKP